MKKAIFPFLALATAFALTGCGRHTHEWREATCTEPRICAECGETEGKPLGHEWREADCTARRICTRCGETEGEPLGHEWRDASCTEPRTCLRCGETEGEPLGHIPLEATYWTPGLCIVCGEELAPALTPDFVTYSIRADMEVGEHYDYETVCYVDPGIMTVGDLAVIDYMIIAADGDHEAKAGYEWRVATFQLLFGDENARENGYMYSFSHGDYYNIRMHDDTTVQDDDGSISFTVNDHGMNRQCFGRVELLSNEWQGETANVSFRVHFQVPVGYDGCVYGMRSAAVALPDDGYIFDVYDPDAFLLFRFD